MKTLLYNSSLIFILLFSHTINAAPINLMPYTQSCYGNDTLHYKNINLNQLGFYNGVLHVKLKLSSVPTNKNEYLKIDFPFIDSVIIYSNSKQLYKLGDAYLFNKRVVKHKSFIIALTPSIISNGLNFTVYCNGEYTRFPLQCGKLSELTNESTNYFVLGTYNGIIVFAFFLSLFLFTSLKEKTYAWYSLFLGATFLFQLSTEGLAFEYLWPTQPWLANHIIPFSGAFALLMLVLFTEELFKNTATKILRTFYFIIKIMLTVFVLFSVLPNPYYGISLVGASVASVVINFILLHIGLYNYIKKHAQAKYYTVAFGLLMLSIILSQLSYIGVVPFNFITSNILFIGSGLQIVLLSMGLSQKVTFLKQQEQLAQEALVAQLKKQTATQQRANEVLELKVNERTEELNLQTKALATLNREHTQSVTYASYIQSSILPSATLIKEKLPNSFFLYAPKDIVSGDFYWFADTHTSATPSVNLQVICAVDCTGHGVPGAFMSLIGKNLLDLTTKDASVNTPADVIQFLNKSLAKTINRDDALEVINDGMDMVVCAYQPVTKTLYYAGANRPLYIVKHATLELIEIKATKVSIGGTTPLTQQWDNVTVQLEEGDCFYLSSDGYADQFGGERNKKMTTKRLKKFLTTIHHQSMEEQQIKLTDFFVSWKGNEAQVDDVMLIGIRV